MLDPLSRLLVRYKVGDTEKMVEVFFKEFNKETSHWETSPEDASKYGNVITAIENALKESKKPKKQKED